MNVEGDGIMCGGGVRGVFEMIVVEEGEMCNV